MDALLVDALRHARGDRTPHASQLNFRSGGSDRADAVLWDQGCASLGRVDELAARGCGAQGDRWSGPAGGRHRGAAGAWRGGGSDEPVWSWAWYWRGPSSELGRWLCGAAAGEDCSR